MSRLPAVERGIVDRIFLSVFGGRGGNGALFYKKHINQKLIGPGIPQGGNGGRGGDVVYVIL